KDAVVSFDKLGVDGDRQLADIPSRARVIQKVAANLQYVRPDVPIFDNADNIPGEPFLQFRTHRTCCLHVANKQLRFTSLSDRRKEILTRCKIDFRWKLLPAPAPAQLFSPLNCDLLPSLPYRC